MRYNVTFTREKSKAIKRGFEVIESEHHYSSISNEALKHLTQKYPKEKIKILKVTSTTTATTERL